MGVYSTNRLSSVTEGVVEEDFELTPNENLGNIMEAVIAVRENEHKMFDSLLELDFVSATNEATLLEADAEKANDAQNQSKLKAVIGKIEELITNAIGAIKTVASNFIGKIKEFLDRDKKLIKAYGDFSVADLKGFKGISNFAFPKHQTIKVDVANDVDNKLKTIGNTSDRDAISQCVEEFKKSAVDLKKAIKMEDYFEEKSDNFVPNDQQLADIISGVTSGKATIASLKKATAETMAKLKKFKSDAKSAIKSSKGDELEVYRAKSVYEVSASFVSGYMKLFNDYTHVLVKQIAAYRKAYIICGKYTKGGKSKDDAKAEEKVEESVLMYTLSESSDEYVYAHFAY